MGIDPYEAAALADMMRRQLVEQSESFIFETVFSDPEGDKLAFLNSAEKAGYAVLLIFIGVSGPGLSDTRVAIRAASGGHNVPRRKLFERFPRTLRNLKRALGELRNVWVFDHSDLDRGYRLVAMREDGRPVEQYPPVPAWLRSLLK